MAPSSTTTVRPATTADLKAAKCQVWKGVQFLNLRLIGANFISHLVATSGGRHILSRGPRGVRLPIEIWYIIIEFLKGDLSYPGRVYRWVRNSPTGSSRVSFGLFGGNRLVRTYPLDWSKVRVSFTLPSPRQPQFSSTRSLRLHNHQFGSRDKITSHDTPSISQDKVARARDSWSKLKSSSVPQDIDVPIVLPSPAAIPSQPTDAPARAGEPFDPIIPCLFVMVDQNIFRRVARDWVLGNGRCSRCVEKVLRGGPERSWKTYGFEFEYTLKKEYFVQQKYSGRKTTEIWVMVCIFQNPGATYDEVKQMISNAREHAAPGAKVSVAGQPVYPDNPTSCFLAGAQMMVDLAKQAGNDAARGILGFDGGGSGWMLC
ncbi:hypothetical protein QBC37DRAFT_377736 [Rhypophila decipiens]|uniref:Uncharacterized protein n=1 Tax=Rhypophila decipiens TaxID=261697 RepID=A0AAN6Y436_9PEZI|nr:hypothetical protein QBC37DRAFT_377736 [Rhypophila decipiens]